MGLLIEQMLCELCEQTCLAPRMETDLVYRYKKQTCCEKLLISLILLNNVEFSVLDPSSISLVSLLGKKVIPLNQWVTLG